MNSLSRPRESQRERERERERIVPSSWSSDQPHHNDSLHEVSPSTDRTQWALPKYRGIMLNGGRSKGPTESSGELS